MSMTLEEAIRHYEESEKINKELAKNCVSAMDRNHNLENAEKCRQMIEWLSELQKRRKQPEIVHCGECRFNDGTAYCVFHFRDVKGNEYCSWAERRADSDGRD